MSTTELDWLKGRYIQELNDLYTDEMENLDVLPQLRENAQVPVLKSAFQYLFEKSRAHIGRLNHIFTAMDVGPEARQRGPRRTVAPDKRGSRAAPKAAAAADADLLSTARNLEHRDVRRYLLAINCAEILRDQEAADLLEKTLSDEYEADQILAGLSEPEFLTPLCREPTY